MAILSELVVAITEEQSEAMEAAIASGEYSSPTQIVQASLDDWKWQREWLKPEHLPRLQEMWREGKESGDAQPLDVDRLLAEARNSIQSNSGKAAA